MELTIQKYQISGLLVLIVVLLVYLYWGVSVDLINSWQDYEEYSHGYFLPIIAGYLIWQRKNNSYYSDGSAPPRR